MNQVQAAGADAGTQSSMAHGVERPLPLPVGKIIFSFVFISGITASLFAVALL